MKKIPVLILFLSFSLILSACNLPFMGGTVLNPTPDLTLTALFAPSEMPSATPALAHRGSFSNGYTSDGNVDQYTHSAHASRDHDLHRASQPDRSDGLRIFPEFSTRD